jgi:hypothetical protein
MYDLAKGRKSLPIRIAPASKVELRLIADADEEGAG